MKEPMALPYLNIILYILNSHIETISSRASSICRNMNKSLAEEAQDAFEIFSYIIPNIFSLYFCIYHIHHNRNYFSQDFILKHVASKLCNINSIEINYIY